MLLNYVQLQPKLLWFKRLFHIGVWTFARFVRPLLAIILCVWEIWSGSNNRMYMYHIFHWLAKKTDYQKKNKKRVTAPILKPTYDQKPETFRFFYLMQPINDQGGKKWRLTVWFQHRRLGELSWYKYPCPWRWKAVIHRAEGLWCYMCAQRPLPRQTQNVCCL